MTTPSGTPKHIQLLQINYVYILSLIFINNQNHISATSMNNLTQQTNKNQGAIATTSEPKNKRIDQEKNNDDWEDDEWWSTNIHDIIAACTPHDTN
ncbi:hypothetical protein Hanom_Chr12g01114011 [Helianthus anomalus]